MQSLIELKNISKAFGDTTVLDDFNLNVNENEFITLLGPSGCGKTAGDEGAKGIRFRSKPPELL